MRLLYDPLLAKSRPSFMGIYDEFFMLCVEADSEGKPSFQ
jgi:hypothetical protein